jgi:2-haloacid dehalogenase
MRLTDFKAMSFDCYGTLIDWETGIVETLKPLTSQVGRSLTRDDILEAHARHESAQQRWTPAKRYPDLLATVYKRLAEEWNVPVSWEDCRRYGGSVGDWPAFPDSREALEYLKQHYRLIILSNVDNASFAVSNAKLGVAFDAVYTAEDIGSYKPDPRNFDYLLRHLAERGIAKEQILHTAESLYHDHIPAQWIGLATCWIHRRAGKEGHGATRVPGGEVRPDFRFESLAAMADAHRAERAA